MAKNPKIVAEFLHGLGNKLQPLWEEEKKVRHRDKKKKILFPVWIYKSNCF